MLDDSYIWTFFIAATALFTVFGVSLVYFVVIQRKNQKFYYLQTEDLKLRHAARELNVRIEENERTMNQISKEVHDNIGQISNMVMMHLRHFEAMLTNEEQRMFNVRIINLTGKLIRDAKNISNSLSGDHIKTLGLHNMIQGDLEHLQISKKMAFEINVTGENDFLNEEKQLIIYRIAQEAVNNILKYSKATFIKVVLDYSNGTFLMSIRDNGVGFDYEKAVSGIGTGIINMTGRADFLNAELNIETAPGKGCTLDLLIKNTPEANLPVTK